VFPCDLGYEIW